MKLNFLRRSQQVCELPEPRMIIPPKEVPREVWLKRFIESYRRTSMQMEMLSDYTKSLESAYRHLQDENRNLRQQCDFIKDYMYHINDVGAHECELRIENRQLKSKLNKQSQLLERFTSNGGGIFKEYKTAIRGQFYYLHYLKTVLHLNHVVYKKKLSFNTLEFDNIDDLINEAVNEKF